MKSQELENQLAQLIAEGDNLEAKVKSNELTDDDSKRYDAVLAEIDEVGKELANAVRSERLAATKVVVNEPRPAPKVNNVKVGKTTNSQHEFSRALASWLSGPGHASHEDHYRAETHGLKIGTNSVRIPLDYKRSISVALSKGDATMGAELGYTTYSDQVTRFIKYASPFVAALSTDVTGDGENRIYFIMDGTSLQSTYMTASGGTEKNPTIPEKSVTTANKTLATFDITSGYHIITWQRLRDAPFNVVAEDVIPAVFASHVRLIEDEIINATGNGSTGVEGLLSVADDSLPAADDWTIDMFESAYFSVPVQYRQNLVWLASGKTKGAVRTALKDDIGRSFFNNAAQDGVEYDVLLGKRFFESDYMPDDQVLLFNPDFYKLRLVGSQTLNVYRELFAPHIAYSSILSWGGGWLAGDTLKPILLEKDASS